RPHGERVRDEARDARQDDRLVRLRGRRANHAGHQTEVGRQPIVEAVHHVAQEAAALGAMPWFARAPRHSAQRGGVLGGFAGEDQRFFLSLAACGRPAMHVEVAANFASLLGQQRGEEQARSKGAAKKGQHARARRGSERLRRPAVAREDLAPDRDMAVLDLGEPQVQVALPRIGLSRGELPVEERGIGLVLPVMLELVEVRRLAFRLQRRGHGRNIVAREAEREGGGSPWGSPWGCPYAAPTLQRGSPWGCPWHGQPFRHPGVTHHRTLPTPPGTRGPVMKPLHLLAGAVVLAAATAPLHAQDEDNGIVRARDLAVRVARAVNGEDSNRAVLGISTRSTGKRDTLGLLVESITSGSPAEKAGLEEGDRIASVNGVNLKL